MGESLNSRVLKLETQVNRLLQDAEQEEANRIRATADLDARLRSVERTVERTIALGVGALGLIQLILASLKYLP